MAIYVGYTWIYWLEYLQNMIGYIIIYHNNYIPLIWVSLEYLWDILE